MKDYLEKTAASLAARGYYIDLRHMRKGPGVKGHVWICDLENDILGQFPRGTGETWLLAVQRALASLELVESTRKGMPE